MRRGYRKPVDLGAKILGAVAQRGELGSTAINRLFHGNVRAIELHAALGALLAAGSIVRRVDLTGGRPVTRWSRVGGVHGG